MIEVGQQASLSKRIMDEDVRTIAGVMLDTNPIHLDDEFASKSRFGKRIVHGVMGLGLISAVLGAQLPGPGTIYISQTARFKGPVYVGDELRTIVAVTEVTDQLVTLKTQCYTINGLVIDGEAIVLVEGTK